MIAPRAHAVLLVDQAGWHMSARLVVPRNITIIPLPSKCPELNPVENVWQFIRDNWLSNRVQILRRTLSIVVVTPIARVGKKASLMASGGMCGGPDRESNRCPILRAIPRPNPSAALERRPGRGHHPSIANERQAACSSQERASGRRRPRGWAIGSLLWPLLIKTNATISLLVV
jgi:hypothetical protein